MLFLWACVVDPSGGDHQALGVLFLDLRAALHKTTGKYIALHVFDSKLSGSARADLCMNQRIQLL